MVHRIFQQIDVARRAVIYTVILASDTRRAVCVDRILIVVRTERTGQAVERKAVIGVTDESAVYYVFVVQNVVRRDDYLSEIGRASCRERVS